MDLTLAVIPLLEIITSVLLMAWMYFWQKYHPLGELTLSETFVNEQVVFLMHGTVAALARSAEDLETSAESGRVPSVEETIGWEVSMSVVHTDRANLFFVTLNAVRRSNVISE